MANQEQSFVPLPETVPELSVGLLGVKVPTEWGMCLDTAQWNFMRDMRLEEIERRILAIEAAQADRNPQGHDPAEGHGRNDESPVGNADAPTPKSIGEHHDRD